MTSKPLQVLSKLNLRDLAGAHGEAAGSGGTLRPGMLFRSGDPHGLAPDEDAVLASLGIRLVVDLRTEHERDSSEMTTREGVEVRWLDVLGPQALLGPARLQAVMSDPVRAEAELGEGRVLDVFRESYRAFVSSPGGRAAYAGLLTAVADAPGPVLIHCTAGKDRTGWAAALILTLLGVPWGQIEADYLLTNLAVQNALAGYRAMYVDTGGDVAILEAAMSADASYLAAALDEVKQTHGDFSHYLTDGLGLDPAICDVLRDKYLEPSG